MFGGYPAKRVSPVCQGACTALLALLELAQVAEQVGRIGRHTLVPPLNALLDLNRAAEQYLEARLRPCKQAV